MILRGCCRSRGNGQNSKSLLLEFVGDCGRGGRRRSDEQAIAVKCALDDSLGNPRLGFVAVASEVFLTGSNGTKAASLGKPVAVLCDAASRMAASTGSWPPSELASAAIPRTCASSKPGNGRTLVTVSSLRVRVPVLSAAQHIDRRSFVHGGKPCWQYALLRESTGSNRGSEGECGRQCDWDDGEDRCQQERNHLA
jgi:hypothetical protein